MGKLSKLPDLPKRFEQLGYVEWTTTTQALTTYFSALGVASPADVAKDIAGDFRTLSDFLTAPDWKLRKVVGRRLARLIKASHELMKAMLEEQVIDAPVISKSQELIDLLQARIGFLQHEQLLALYVDMRCHLMRIERIGEGTINGAPIDKHRLFRCALTIGAAGFVLVHNHPTGVPKPSDADIHLTDSIAQAARQFDLYLLDHLIIARGKVGTIKEFWYEARYDTSND